MEVTRRYLLIGGIASSVSAIAFTQSRPAGILGTRTADRRTGVILDVRQFGARGDGRSDDRVAIQRAIDEATRVGGGTVHLPAGTYAVSRAAPSAFAILLRSGVFLEGTGRSSVVKLQAGSGGHLINVTREANCGIRGMVLDGNRLEQPSLGHGFRSGGVDGLQLEDLLIVNAFHYGIGLEGGDNRGVVIRRVEIADCGGDGIDIKNKSNDNSIVTISDVSVRRWGLRTDSQTQAGIDCRGPVRLSGIRVSNPVADDAVGVRMRQGEIGDVNGLGAHNARLENFDVQMGNGRTQVGVDVVARSVVAANGTVSGGFRGLAVHASGFRANGVRVSGCSGSGILLNAHGSGLNADDAVLSNCTVTNCADDGIDVETNNVQILDCTSTGSGRYGLSVRETASGTVVIRGNFSRNRAGSFFNRGRNSRFAVSAP
ncbi:MAG TPA: glycosyl hydrolase family 28-related protein [Sphingomicrobium sp.]|nr:glycosyl hydrolase family 28-related protein [Sphingomicrobium sp.]